MIRFLEMLCVMGLGRFAAEHLTTGRALPQMLGLAADGTSGFFRSCNFYLTTVRALSLFDAAVFHIVIVSPYGPFSQ